MLRNYEYHFEVKPGKFVFVPTEACLKVGAEIVNQVTKAWRPHNIFYHFGKRGGHVSALRTHLDHGLFAKVDLTQFFTSVTRTKVVRSLQKIGFNNKTAFNMAYESVVEFGGKKFLPYGFVQSMVLATICIEFSSLGSALIRTNGGGNVRVSMYVDDIILSSDDEGALVKTYDEVLNSVRQSNFRVNTNKSIPPATEIEVFNCRLSKGITNFTEDRMSKFFEDFGTGDEFTKAAIVRYMKVVNKDQLDEILASLGFYKAHLGNILYPGEILP